MSPSEVEELIWGIEAESANLGMQIPSGTISEKARRTAQEYFENEGIRIELINGEQLATLIVENGVRVM